MQDEGRKFIWVTGQSGCGKTTLGQQLRARAGFVHFDGDVFANGGQPEVFSGIPTKEMLEHVDPKLKGTSGRLCARVLCLLFPFLAHRAVSDDGA